MHAHGCGWQQRDAELGLLLFGVVAGHKERNLQRDAFPNMDLEHTKLLRVTPERDVVAETHTPADDHDDRAGTYVPSLRKITQIDRGDLRAAEGAKNFSSMLTRGALTRRFGRGLDFSRVTTVQRPSLDSPFEAAPKDGRQRRPPSERNTTKDLEPQVYRNCVVEREWWEDPANSDVHDAGDMLRSGLILARFEAQNMKRALKFNLGTGHANHDTSSVATSELHARNIRFATENHHTSTEALKAKLPASSVPPHVTADILSIKETRMAMLLEWRRDVAQCCRDAPRYATDASGDPAFLHLLQQSTLDAEEDNIVRSNIAQLKAYLRGGPPASAAKPPTTTLVLGNHGDGPRTDKVKASAPRGGGVEAPPLRCHPRLLFDSISRGTWRQIKRSLTTKDPAVPCFLPPLNDQTRRPEGSLPAGSEPPRNLRALRVEDLCLETAEVADEPLPVYYPLLDDAGANSENGTLDWSNDDDDNDAYDDDNDAYDEENEAYDEEYEAYDEENEAYEDSIGPPAEGYSPRGPPPPIGMLGGHAVIPRTNSMSELKQRFYTRSEHSLLSHSLRRKTESMSTHEMTQRDVRRDVTAPVGDGDIHRLVGTGVDAIEFRRFVHSTVKDPLDVAGRACAELWSDQNSGGPLDVVVQRDAAPLPPVPTAAWAIDDRRRWLADISATFRKVERAAMSVPGNKNHRCNVPPADIDPPLPPAARRQLSWVDEQLLRYAAETHSNVSFVPLKEYFCAIGGNIMISPVSCLASLAARPLDDSSELPGPILTDDSEFAYGALEEDRPTVVDYVSWAYVQQIRSNSECDDEQAWTAALLCCVPAPLSMLTQRIWSWRRRVVAAVRQEEDISRGVAVYCRSLICTIADEAAWRCESRDDEEASPFVRGQTVGSRFLVHVDPARPTWPVAVPLLAADNGRSTKARLFADIDKHRAAATIARDTMQRISDRRLNLMRIRGELARSIAALRVESEGTARDCRRGHIAEFPCEETVVRAFVVRAVTRGEPFDDAALAPHCRNPCDRHDTLWVSDDGKSIHETPSSAFRRLRGLTRIESGLWSVILAIDAAVVLDEESMSSYRNTITEYNAIADEVNAFRKAYHLVWAPRFVDSLRVTYSVTSGLVAGHFDLGAHADLVQRVAAFLGVTQRELLENPRVLHIRTREMLEAHRQPLIVHGWNDAVFGNFHAEASVGDVLPPEIVASVAVPSDAGGPAPSLGSIIAEALSEWRAASGSAQAPPLMLTSSGGTTGAALQEHLARLDPADLATAYVALLPYSDALRYSKSAWSHAVTHQRALIVESPSNGSPMQPIRVSTNIEGDSQPEWVVQQRETEEARSIARLKAQRGWWHAPPPPPRNADATKRPTATERYIAARTARRSIGYRPADLSNATAIAQTKLMESRRPAHHTARRGAPDAVCEGTNALVPRPPSVTARP